MSPLIQLYLFYWLIKSTISQFTPDYYKDCLWFGGLYDTPLYPIGVCSAVQGETDDEKDGLATYSYMYQCIGSTDLKVVVWNNEDCNGDIYYNSTFRIDSGYYWNCAENAYGCPYTKMKLYDLYNDTEHNDDHGDHLCTIDVNIYEEYSFVTNVCNDFGSNIYYQLDCDAKSVSFAQYYDSECTELMNITYIEEGCDDPFKWDAYIQITECEDADFHPTPQPTQPNDNNDNATDNDLAIIFTIIIAAIIVILVLLIGIGITKRNKLKVTKNKELKQKLNKNIYNEIQPDPKQQQNITGGNDVDEIFIPDNDVVDQMR